MIAARHLLTARLSIEILYLLFIAFSIAVWSIEILYGCSIASRQLPQSIEIPLLWTPLDRSWIALQQLKNTFLILDTSRSVGIYEVSIYTILVILVHFSSISLDSFWPLNFPNFSLSLKFTFPLNFQSLDLLLSRVWFFLIL